MSSVIYTFTSFTTSNSYIVKPFNDEKCFIVDLPPDLDNVIEFIKNNNFVFVEDQKKIDVCNSQILEFVKQKKIEVVNRD